MSEIPLANTRSEQASALRKLVEVARQAERSGVPVTFVHHGDPDFDTPCHIKQAATDAMNAGFTRYVPNKGIAELREAVADRLRRENGIVADPESEVIISNGGTLGLWLAISVAIDPGDEVLLPEPSFDAYPGMVTLARGTPVSVPTIEHDGRFALDKAELEKRITSKTKAIIINSPNNPTGTVYTRDELVMVAELAVEHGLTIISDEAYEKLLYDGHIHYSIASFGREVQQRTITVNSFSKAYAMTGWRLGYLTANKEATRAMSHLYQHSARCATAFVQMAGVEALRGSQECVSEMVREYADRREMLVNGLGRIEGVGYSNPQGAFYVFPDISVVGVNSWEFVQYLLEKERVLAVPGSIYGHGGEYHVRISFCKSKHDIEKAIDGIERAVNDLRGKKARS